ncbi:RutC-like superfamily protein [Abortiporus biennis]
MSQLFKTANPYESQWGYSRAVRKGPFIFVSGTTAVDTSTGFIPPNLSAYEQAQLIFKEIIRAVEGLGGRKEDITRVRMFVEKDEEFEQVGKALKESLGEVGPAATGIVVL